MTRWVLYAVAAAGVAAVAHDAVDPPLRRTVVVTTRGLADTGARWYALAFARAYFTWSADPAVHQRALAPLTEEAADRDAGLTPAAATTQVAGWAEIAGVSPGSSGAREYTVAVSTGGGVRFLSVAVGRDAHGAPVLERYPALVAAPPSGDTGVLDGASLPAVTNPAASAVVDRALRNYLAGSTQNLDADLAPHATVDPAAPGLTALGVQRVGLEPSGAVLATVRAADAAGDVFTLAYRVWLVDAGGRWEITRIAP